VSSSTIAAAQAAPASATRAIVPMEQIIAAVDDEEDDDASDTEDRKSGTLRRAASAALRHLAPVSKAQAAPAVHVRTAAEEGWSVQLGAYRDQSAARQALRRASGLDEVSGKPQQVLAPAKSDRRGLYRARLLGFSESGARSVCGSLKKRRIECTVVRSPVKLARG